MKKFMRQVMPGQEFMLIRTGEWFKFLRRDYSTPKGTKYVCLNLTGVDIKEYPKESQLHHSCHVWVKEDGQQGQ